MKKYILLSLCAGIAATMQAQDSFDTYTFANSDLNGTARYVGMGGAIGALGGDVSVMGSNPAGTAMYRSNDAAITLSGQFTGEGVMGHDAARMSLDQGGILLAFDMNAPTSKGLQFVNFGFNFVKKRNFLSNQATNVMNLNNTFSQTFQIADMCNDAWDNDFYGTLADLSAATDKRPGLLNERDIDIVDVNGNPVLDEDGNKTFYRQYEGVAARSAYYERATFGANTQADLNLSFNISDQFFLGASLGVYNMDYTRESFYKEVGIDNNVYDLTNWYKTHGDGFDVKFGFIVRPIEDSPFRIGFTAHTPTWYRLIDSNGATLNFHESYIDYKENGEYEYRFHTPWKLGVSLGHTIGKSFAFGAEYEYQDFSTNSYSVWRGQDRDYFRNQNSITKQTFRAQHTLKVGFEYKPIEEFSVRLGYNFVSSPFKNNAYRTIGYDGVYTETDYTIWGATHRFTCGFGYRFKGGYFDLAYQYQGQKGDFYAFDDIDFKSTKIDNIRHQVMGTLGFRF